MADISFSAVVGRVGWDVFGRVWASRQTPDTSRAADRFSRDCRLIAAPSAPFLAPLQQVVEHGPVSGVLGSSVAREREGSGGWGTGEGLSVCVCPVFPVPQAGKWPR